MKNTIITMLLVVFVGGGVGLAYNAMRSDKRITLQRNYFRILTDADDDDEVTAVNGQLTSAPTDAQKDVPRSGDADPSDEAEPSDKPVKSLQHPFTSVTVYEVMDIFEGPALTGMAVFVDARNRVSYEQGHIPGAINIDNYNVDEDFPKVSSELEVPEIIVVYCGGGDCEDSIFLSSELVTRGIPKDKIRLFEGGIKEWQNEGLTLEEGPGRY
jgi:rhodanese-related sulfurtransferase